MNAIAPIVVGSRVVIARPDLPNSRFEGKVGTVIESVSWTPPQPRMARPGEAQKPPVPDEPYLWVSFPAPYRRCGGELFAMTVYRRLTWPREVDVVGTTTETSPCPGGPAR